MGRSYNTSATIGLSVGSVIATAYPLSISMWFRANTLTGTAGMTGIVDVGVGNHVLGAILLNYPTAGKISGQVNNSSAPSIPNVFITSTTTIVASRWYHVLLSLTAGSGTIWVDGAGSATNTWSGTPNAMTNSYVLGYSGSAARVAYWSAALDEIDARRLASGVDPQSIRPTDIIAYWPLEKHDRSTWGRYNLTPAAAAAWCDDQPQAKRRRVRRVGTSAAAYTLTCNVKSGSGAAPATLLAVGRQLAASVSAGTGSAPSATLTASRRMTATVIAGSGTPQAATLTTTRRVTATATAGTGSASACTLAASRHLMATVVAGTGSGPAATLTTARIVAAAVATGAGTGVAATLTHAAGLLGQVAVGAGAATATALTAARILAGQSVSGTGTATAATLTVDGASVAYSLTCGVTAGTGTAQDATLRVSRLLATSVRACLGAAQAVTLERSAEIDLDVDASHAFTSRVRSSSFAAVPRPSSFVAARRKTCFRAPRRGDCFTATVRDSTFVAVERRTL